MKTDPLQRNRYAYTASNPLVRYDLNGLFWDEIGDFAGSVKDAAVGTWNDFEEGGFTALAQDWKEGWDSMSTGEQVALVAVPATAATVAVGVEAAGVGGTVIAADTIATGTGALLGRIGLKCAEKGGEAGRYEPYVPNRPLPKNEFNEPSPESEYPHTELGTRNGYPQAREWNNKDAIRDIDFTDHGTPEFHDRPHFHPLEPNNPEISPHGGYRRLPGLPFHW